MITVIIWKPTCCYFWLKNRYKCVYVQTISFQGSFKLCVKSHFLLYHLSLVTLAVELGLTKWGCSHGNNNVFSYLKSFTMLVKKNASIPCECQIVPQNGFNSHSFITCSWLFPWLIVTSRKRLLKTLVNESHPALDCCRIVWCICCVHFQKLIVIVSPQSLLFQWGLIILTLYNLLSLH